VYRSGPVVRPAAISLTLSLPPLATVILVRQG
jgi:hypothetical protein